MRKVLPIVLAGLTAFSFGCSAEKEAADVNPKPAAAAQSVKSPDFAQHGVSIYVDGRQRGSTPKTVRIRRGFGDSEVSLRKGKEVVRKYEIEMVRTSNVSEMALGGGMSGVRTSFNTADLNKTRKGTFIVPYYAHAIRVEDHEFGLTLLVED